VSVASDVWDAAKLAALSIGLVVAAVVGTAVFALDVMLTGLLVVLLVGITGLTSALLQPFARKLLPERPTPALVVPDAPPLAAQDPAEAATALQRNYELSQQAERPALRLVREELLDNRHALERYLLDQDLAAIEDLTYKRWNEQRKTLLGLSDPEPHEMASEAYRLLGVFTRGLYRRAGVDLNTFELDPDPQHPVNADVRTAIRAINDAANVLTEARRLT
jgi:hypothetical protein